MNNLNYKILGMVVSTFCMVLTRPNTSGDDMFLIFYISLFVWVYFTIKVATHIPHEK